MIIWRAFIQYAIIKIGVKNKISFVQNVLFSNFYALRYTLYMTNRKT